MDHLAALKSHAPSNIEGERDNVGLVRPGNVNSSSPAAGGANNEFMPDFFADVVRVKENIDVIREASERISELNQNVMQATTPEREQACSEELEPLVKTTNKKAAVAKQLLTRMREDTERLKTTGGSTGKNSSEVRIRENLSNTLTRKFVEIMKDYQSVQTKYKTDIKKKVKRQVQIVKPDATTEEIDAVFKSGGGASEVFKTAILSGEASESIQNAFKNAADKYQDVLALEASVSELHQMFLDFALLTEKQGELLDQIEHQVKEAGEYIDAGNIEMVEAIEIQKSIRYKQCCVFMIAFVIVGIIIAVIVAKVNGSF